LQALICFYFLLLFVESFRNKPKQTLELDNSEPTKDNNLNHGQVSKNQQTKSTPKKIETIEKISSTPSFDTQKQHSNNAELKKRNQPRKRNKPNPNQGSMKNKSGVVTTPQATAGVQSLLATPDSSQRITE
jgi:hypothetical protein